MSDLGTAVIRYSDMDLAVFEEDSDLALGKSILPESLVEEVEDLEGVEEAAGISTAFGELLKGTNPDEESGKKTSVIFIGVEPGSFLEPAVQSGEALNIDQPQQVLVDSSLETEGFSLGDTLTLSGIGTEFEIGGFIIKR